MGSAADLSYGEELEKIAYELGKEVAASGATLVYGAEKDYDSLSTAASRGARSVGGLTVGVTYGKGHDIYDDADVVIATGLERGGGREFVLVLSCDAIIAVGGGSGTLTELVIGYQANIPLIVMENSGGWSEKLQDTFFDARERIKILKASTPKEAVELATSLAKR